MTQTIETPKEKAIREMRNGLVASSKQFAYYAKNHFAKSPPDYEKGKTNAHMATCMDRLVRQYDETN